MILVSEVSCAMALIELMQDWSLPEMSRHFGNDGSGAILSHEVEGRGPIRRLVLDDLARSAVRFQQIIRSRGSGKT